MSRHAPNRAWSAVSLALAVAFGARTAAAQIVVGDPEARSTRGVYIAGAARAGDADASAVQLNPAQLGLLPAADLELAAGIWSQSAPLPGRGLGAFWGAPIFGSSALGLGLSRVADSPALGVESHTVFQLAYALRLGRSAALGASWAHIWGSTFAGANTFDAGLSYRAGRYVALGLVVEDLGEPSAAALTPVGTVATIPRLWAGELLARPLGTGRLELGVGAAHAEGELWRAFVPRARLAAAPADGLHLYATAEALPTGTESVFSSADLRLTFGLTFYLDHFGATAGSVVAPSGDGSAGGALVVHVTGEQRRPLASTSVFVKVSLEGLEPDRAYLELVQRLRALETDPTITGVLLKLENLELGLGRIEELRDLVAALRAHGKVVVAYGNFPTTRAYYLAVACNAIVVHPAGELSLTGFSQTVTFYKGAMDRLGINVDLVRIAEFKGAMEPFVMTEQSPPVRLNKNELLDDTFGRLVVAIVSGRAAAGHTLDEARVRALIDRGLYTPFEAQLMGLVDAVKDDSELEGYLRQALGRPGLALRDLDTSPRHADAWAGRRVAVVLVDGAIVDGGSRRLPFELGAFAGSDTLVAALEECTHDPSVGAVVLRVNSPGGSAFASDVIARAIGELRKAGKAVVVSMGDVAASGGYYIAAPADVIFSEPSTITGSIGIFGYKVDVRKLIGLLGVSVETYRRGHHSDFYSPYRPWTDEEIQLASEKIRHFYGLFLNTVAEGRRSRGLTLARVDDIGRGHVWTGAQALGLGLVDRMGGVAAAVDEAAQRAHVPVGSDGQPELLVLPRPQASAIQKLLGLDGDESQAAVTVRALLGTGAVVRLLAPLLAGPGTGIEARLPYDIEIR
jgi:protease-4